MRESLNFAWYQLRYTLTSPRFYASIAILMGAMYAIFGKLGGYLAANELSIQATEMFTIYTNSQLTQRFMLLGSLLLLADAPFIREGVSYRLIRSTKLRWYIGQLLYCAVIVILYLAATFAAILICTNGHIYFQNVWSASFTALCEDYSSCYISGNVLGISILLGYSIDIINGGTPYFMFGLSFLYAFLLLLANCFIVQALNCWFRTGVGIAATVLLIALQYMSSFAEGFMQIFEGLYFDPCSMAQLTTRALSARNILFVCSYFVLLFCLFGLLGYRGVKRKDMQRMPQE